MPPDEQGGAFDAHSPGHALAHEVRPFGGGVGCAALLLFVNSSYSCSSACFRAQAGWRHRQFILLRRSLCGANKRNTDFPRGPQGDVEFHDWMVDTYAAGHGGSLDVEARQKGKRLHCVSCSVGWLTVAQPPCGTTSNRQFSKCI